MQLSLVHLAPYPLPVQDSLAFGVRLQQGLQAPRLGQRDTEGGDGGEAQRLTDWASFVVETKQLVAFAAISDYRASRGRGGALLLLPLVGGRAIWGWGLLLSKGSGGDERRGLRESGVTVFVSLCLGLW